MSSVPEALAAVAVIGRAVLPNSQTLDGPTSGVTMTSGRLFLVGDEEFEIVRELDSLGGSSATEDYTIPCATVADLNTPNQYDADSQAWADYEALEAVLAADPSLGLSATFSLNATITEPRFRRLGDENGRHAMVRFGIHIYSAARN